MSGGTKHDQDKPQPEFLSPIWLLSVSRVLSFGARKYAGHNWRKGIQISRLMGAALRHQLAFLGGEDNDPETGLPHLSHASCCLMFASEMMVTRPDMDDRYKSDVSRLHEKLKNLDLIKSNKADPKDAPPNAGPGEWVFTCEKHQIYTSGPADEFEPHCEQCAAEARAAMEARKK